MSQGTPGLRARRACACSYRVRKKLWVSEPCVALVLPKGLLVALGLGECNFILALLYRGCPADVKHRNGRAHHHTRRLDRTVGHPTLDAQRHSLKRRRELNVTTPTKCAPLAPIATGTPGRVRTT